MHVANFTPDKIKWMHVGITGTLKPGDITEFDDARGKHILNKWGQRGLLRVTFEDRDNEDEKRVEAMEIYNEFWVKQITNFNQHNESLKNENKPYVYPTKELRGKAEDLKIQLVGPWEVKTEPAGVDQKELDSLKEQIAKLSKLEDMVGQLMNQTGELTRQRDDALISQFQGLDGDDFGLFVLDNMMKIRTWPEHIQILVQSKWEDTQKEPYPITS